ncbi:MAG TPA: hypothetical protein PLS73_13845, partial [Saprospiraceae bacterium]|nr:hypothetical protein [Saprospiraceae bacterium]
LAIDFLTIDFLAIDFLAIDFLTIDFLTIDFFATAFLSTDSSLALLQKKKGELCFKSPPILVKPEINLLNQAGSFIFYKYRQSIFE